MPTKYRPLDLTAKIVFLKNPTKTKTTKKTKKKATPIPPPSYLKATIAKPISPRSYLTREIKTSALKGLSATLDILFKYGLKGDSLKEVHWWVRDIQSARQDDPLLENTRYIMYLMQKYPDRFVKDAKRLISAVMFGKRFTPSEMKTSAAMLKAANTFYANIKEGKPLKATLARAQDRAAQMRENKLWAIKKYPKEYGIGIQLSALYASALWALTDIPGPLVFLGRDCEMLYMLVKCYDKYFPTHLLKRSKYLLAPRALTRDFKTRVTYFKRKHQEYLDYLERVVPKSLNATFIDTGLEGSIPDWLAKRGWKVAQIKMIGAHRKGRGLLPESYSEKVTQIVIPMLEHRPQRLRKATSRTEIGAWPYSKNAAGFWARFYGIVDGIDEYFLEPIPKKNPLTRKYHPLDLEAVIVYL